MNYNSIVIKILTTFLWTRNQAIIRLLWNNIKLLQIAGFARCICPMSASIRIVARFVTIVPRWKGWVCHIASRIIDILLNAIWKDKLVLLNYLQRAFWPRKVLLWRLNGHKVKIESFRMCLFPIKISGRRLFTPILVPFRKQKYNTYLHRALYYSLQSLLLSRSMSFHHTEEEGCYIIWPSVSSHRRMGKNKLSWKRMVTSLHALKKKKIFTYW